MEAATGIKNAVWIFLITLALNDMFTAIAEINSSSNGSVRRQPWTHAEQLTCELSESKRYLQCHLPMLDDRVDFKNYAGNNIIQVEISCDKKRHSTSRLSARLFEPLGHTLKYITIYDCNFIKISKNAFRGLNGLSSLWIKGESYSQIRKVGLHSPNVSNSLHHIRTETAVPYTASIYDHNNFVLPAGVFSDLTNLNHIELSTMRLDSSAWHELKYLKHVEDLDLSINNITVININILNNLLNLGLLNLRENYIQNIFNGSFESLSLLQHLDLSRNKIKIIERDAFKGLARLTTLFLSGNRIKTLYIDTFKELRKLYVLDMSRNIVNTVEVDAFKGLRNLYQLNLSGNSIKTVEQNTFRGLSNLRWLLLANNKMRTISGTALSRLSSLRALDISLNLIKTLPNLPILLQSLDLRNNSIVGLTNNSFERLLYLSKLDLSHNKIIECTRYIIPDTVAELNLSSNDLSGATLNLNHNLRFADLRNNRLESLTIEGLENYRDATVPGDIYLAGNGYPFRCICNIDMLYNETTFRFDNGNDAQYHIWNFSSLACLSDNKPGITRISVAKFICNTYCYGTCTCYHWRYRNNNISIVDCKNAGLTSVPVNISVTCTILDLSGNIFTSLGPGNFDGLTQLVELYLNSCNITAIKEGTFEGLSYLTKLALSNNSIRQLDSDVFKGLSMLIDLDVSLNTINMIMKNTFKSLNGLSYLDIAGNELETISSSDIESVYTLRSLKLSNNPWSCDCTFLADIMRLAANIYIQDQSNMTCFTPNKTEYYVMSLYMPEFCPDPETEKQRHTAPVEIALYCIVGLGVLGIFCFAFLFRNRKILKLWFFIKCGWKSTSAESEDWDRPYDAFVSYSHADEAFVTRELMPRLEEPRQGRQGYNLCVHFRDFPVGGHIPETILGAVNNSRRVIMILSDDFLSSEWCNYEFQAAHHQLLTEWQNRIIMILLHDLNSNLLDRQLKLYLSTRTYVKLGDRLFWDKIEYAMPERKQPKEEYLHAENINNQEDNMQVEGDEQISDDEELLN